MVPTALVSCKKHIKFILAIRSFLKLLSDRVAEQICGCGSESNNLYDGVNWKYIDFLFSLFFLAFSL